MENPSATSGLNEFKTTSPSPETLRAFEAVPDLYLILSTDFFILTASNSYLEATEKERENIRGELVFDAFPDNPALLISDATTNLRKSLEWVIENKKPHIMALQRYDIPLVNLPGSFKENYWRPINTPVLDDKGNVQYIIHKVEDVTRESKIQQELNESKLKLIKALGEHDQAKNELSNSQAEAVLERKRLYNLLMQAPALICILEGPEHVYKLVNPPYQNLVGDRPLLGVPIAEAMPEVAGQPAFDLLNQVYRTGESIYAHEVQVPIDHHNNGRLGQNYYNFTYQPILNQSGATEGILVFAYEVTTQVEARQQVEQREQDLKKLNEQLLAANAATKATNEKLTKTQQALQELNHELEERVNARTRELEAAKGETEAQASYLQKLFMEAPAPIVILDGPELTYQLVNPAYQRIFPGRELLGKPLMEALPELEGTPIPAIIGEVYQTGKSFVAQELPLKMSRHQGAPPEEIFWTFTYQARRNEKGVVNGIMVFANEVTDQVNARRVVEQSVKQLQLITDALPVLIGYLDKEEKYRFANKAYEFWFPLKSADLIGQPVRQVLGEKAYANVKNYIDRALSGERLDFESRMPYRDNFTKYIRTSYIPDFREGEVAGFYSLVQDITEQVEVRLEIEEREKEAKTLTWKLAVNNEELSTTIEQLKRTNADLDNFVYTASHDLKAPIHNIEGLVQVLLEIVPFNVLASEEIQSIVTMIEGSINRFKRTIEQLTDVSKLQKEADNEKVEVNISEVIRNVTLDLGVQLVASGAQIKVELDKCPSVKFSEKNLRSIVFNLLSNAIKYRSPERTPIVHVSCHSQGEYVVLTIRDNGLGMNLNGSQKLFSMFGRLHDHVEGSGIGLYMVKKIVDNAEGKIKVESEVGVGSTFNVYLKK